jgi:hypothetical protein
MFISELESRFLYPATDARSVVRSVKVFVPSLKVERINCTFHHQKLEFD